MKWISRIAGLAAGTRTNPVRAAVDGVPQRRPEKLPGGIWYTPPTERPPGDSVSIWQTVDRILIEPSAWHGPTGFHVTTEPIVRLALDASDADLGREIRAVLEAHRDEVSDVPRESISNKALLRAAGVKLNREFGPTTRCVSVEVRGSEFSVLPSRNQTTRNPRAGWFWLEHRHVIEAPTDQALGQVVRRAIAECTFAPPVRHRTPRGAADDPHAK